MSTPQHTAVREELARDGSFRSAQQIFTKLRSRGSRIGLTTVYRALQRLAESAEVDILRGEDGEASYRLCSAGHHHHLVCRRCGRTVEVEGRAVERWAESVAAANGFTEVEHTAEVFGICSQCG